MSTGAGPHPEALLALAVAVAHEAAGLLRPGRESMSEQIGTKSSPTDIVTAMDRASEELIVNRLLAARPDDGVLGEEGGARTGSSGVHWVIDPIDGTVNFLYRLPSWSISIGAEVDGTVVAGVVLDVPRGITWTATIGGGAFRDGRQVHCSEVDDLAGTLLATGFSYSADRRAAWGRVIAGVLPRVRDIRRLGSAALDLCSAAAGHVDAYAEQQLHPWDLAAGGLIAAEGGCRLGGLRGAAAGEDLVIAAPPALFGPLHDLLLEHGAGDLVPSSPTT